MRITIAITAACLGMIGLALADDSLASMKQPTAIAPQKLRSALSTLAHERQLRLLYRTELVGDTLTQGANGVLTLDEAMQALLDGTGLSYRFIDEKTVKITAAEADTAQVTSRAPVAPASVARPIRLAQDSRASNTAEPTKLDALDEVVVTAQMREENLQDVPVSVQVITGDMLEQQNLSSLTGLSLTVPSVHVGSGGGRTTTLYIRGIGSGQNQSFDQSVGTFVDNIYHGRSHTSEGSFLDLDRVEILKGPQSTFFGNNSIGGAFNILTRKPGRSFEASARALYGEFGHYAVEGAAGGPITDTFGIRVAATANGGDGWIRNVNTGSHAPENRNLAGRITLAYTPLENLETTLKIEGGRFRNEGTMHIQGARCPPPPPFTAAGFCNLAMTDGVPIGLDSNLNASSPGEKIDHDSSEAVLTANYRAGDHVLTSVTGYYDYDYDLTFDVDFTPRRLLTAALPERYHQFSQELRLVSPSGRTLEYMAGGYYQSSQLTYQQDQSFFFLSPTVSGLAPFASLVPYLPIGTRVDYTQPEHSYAAFGSLSWNITDQLKLSGGLRASRVEKDYAGSFQFGTATQDYGSISLLPADLQSLANLLGLGRAYSASGSRKDDAWLPSAKIQYQINPDAMAYTSYARGFKAGGFNGTDNTGDPTNIPFSPEYVNAYEVGLKSKWLDNRLLLNIAVFRSDYEDLQVSQNRFLPTGAALGVVANAAQARSQGVEIEAQWAVAEGFRLAAAGSYNDAKYGSYPNVALTQLQAFCHAAANVANSSCIDAFGGDPGVTQDLSGRPTPFAPRWSGNLTGAYSSMLRDDYQLTAQLVGVFSSSYFMNDGLDDPMNEQGAFTRLDGRLSLDSADGRWGIDVIGQNLTDRTIITYSTVNWPTSLGSAAWQKQQPRNFAVQGRVQW